MSNLISFEKYHGTGNDFVMLNHITQDPVIDPLDYEFIRLLCDRHFGIGADGLIILEPHEMSDFYMRYYNSDGRPGSFCGNGSRCTVAFAQSLDLVANKRSRFFGSDGIHEAILEDDLVFVKMALQSIEKIKEHIWELDTGSPHYVEFVPDMELIDPFVQGKNIRYSDQYNSTGINVNFVEIQKDYLYVKTYERGVENLTLSCGTGVTAAAIAHALGSGFNGSQEIKVKSMGGDLVVRLNNLNGHPKEIWLGGPAKRVFEGNWDV